MGLFFNRNKRTDSETEYYKDLYEEYHGRRPDHRLSDDEMIELESLDDDEWDED